MTAQPAWQRARNALRAAPNPTAVIGLGVACGDCGHPRSSHSRLIVTAACRAAGCGCGCFDPVCVCGHGYHLHAWDIPSDRFGCATCTCGTWRTGRPLSPAAGTVTQPSLFHR